MEETELAARLQLTPDLKSKTEAIFKKMKTQAVDLGGRLAEEERALDRQFAAKSVTPATLQLSLERIGKLQAELRRAHLEAHLKQTALLSHTQIAAYSKLRGYGAEGDPSSHGHRHH